MCSSWNVQPSRFWFKFYLSAEHDRWVKFMHKYSMLISTFQSCIHTTYVTPDINAAGLAIRPPYVGRTSIFQPTSHRWVADSWPIHSNNVFIPTPIQQEGHCPPCCLRHIGDTLPTPQHSNLSFDIFTNADISAAVSCLHCWVPLQIISGALCPSRMPLCPTWSPSSPPTLSQRNPQKNGQKIWPTC
jgi:hypothetical protein